MSKVATKKSAKKVAAAKAPRADSKKMRLFALLAKHPNGLSNAQIREKLETSAIAAMCRDEAEAGNLKVFVPEEGERGLRYTLAAPGKKALEASKKA